MSMPVLSTSLPVVMFTIRGRELPSYNENGTTYFLLQSVKDTFFKEMYYSAFLRRKNKIVTGDQPTPSKIVEYCRRNCFLGVNTHRSSSLSLRQVETFLEKFDDGVTPPMSPPAHFEQMAQDPGLQLQTTAPVETNSFSSEIELRQGEGLFFHDEGTVQNPVGGGGGCRAPTLSAGQLTSFSKFWLPITFNHLR